MRNNSIDIFKLIFMLIICYHHATWIGLTHGYLPVEFFFMVTGFFLYRTYLKKNIDIKQYFIHRVKRIYTSYLPVLVFYVSFALLMPQFYIGQSFDNWFLIALRDLFLLQGTGMTGEWSGFVRFNPYDWFLSVLLWGGMIVYAILRLSKNWRIIFIIISLSVFSYYTVNSNINSVWCYKCCFYMPLWRGISGMALGALIGFIYYNTNIITSDKSSRILSLLSIIVIPIVFYCFWSSSNIDYLGILGFIIILISCLNEKTILYKIGTKMPKVPDITLEMLLIHKFIIIVSSKICAVIGVPIAFNIFLFAILVISCSIVYKKSISLTLNKFQI